MNFAALRYEELSLNTFPSLHTQVYDGWILRFREDGDWHDSCVLPLYLSTRSYEDKQVLSSNLEALSLYRSLGFQEIYLYWYRVKNG